VRNGDDDDDDDEICIWLKKAVPLKSVITFFFVDAELFVLVGRAERSCLTGNLQHLVTKFQERSANP
jgi:hypothetical protein